MEYIDGFNKNYMVSDEGKVVSLRFNKIRFLKETHDNYGYCITRLRIKKTTITLKLHRIVAFAFLENPLNKQEVNHINGIKTDNSIENLEWVTRSENLKHAYNLGFLRPPCRIGKGKNQIKTK